MIILKNIIKDYKLGSTKVRALNKINLAFKTKEFVCVHGPSGCGKTTLLNIIGGLDSATSGQLIIKGKDTSNFNDEDWDSYRNQEIGFVFQNYYLLPQLNVFENIEIALELINLDKETRIKMVNDALMSVGLLDQAKKMPNQLSGGQIQRVAIARAIVNEPSIILADEPTGALDSKNAAVVMGILKELAKDKLVILVSHNIELANKYVDRIIEMFDSEVTSDSGISNAMTEDKQYIKKKTSMGFFTSLKISIRNLFRTRLRTPLIIFAGSIGMVGIGLVLSISKGVNQYIDDIQKSALVNYPVYIRASGKILDDEGEEKPPLVKFPEGNEIHVIRGQSKYDYYSTFDTDFVEYIEQLNKEYWTLIKYNRFLYLNLASYNKNTDNYSRTTGGPFFEMTEDLSFMDEQYELLYGEFPKEANQLALLISDDNSISASLLTSLNVDSSKDKITFAEVLETQYRVISNNDLYNKDGTGKFSRNYYSSEVFYDLSDLTLNITAIIRPKKDGNANIYTNGILYSKELFDVILERNLNTDIVQEQIEYELTKNVLTNEPFKTEITDSFTMSAMYIYERQLYELGALPRVDSINIYTEKFHNRLLVKEYVNNYPNKEDSKVNINYLDNMDTMTNEFTELVRVFSTVLIIFSSVSLVVSAIMIGIITYVSVIQRTKEIGLLRSIGARKKDIARLFNVETLLIGFASGILGIIGVLILLNPVNNFVQNMVSQYTYSFRGVEKVIIAKFEILYMVVILVGSMLLSIISGFIPAILASKKSPIDALRNER